MDTDALSLKNFETLRKWRAVLGRQGGPGLKPAVGLMMFEKHSPFVLELLGRMEREYSGVWAAHAVEMLDRRLAEGVGGVAQRSLSRDTCFASFRLLLLPSNLLSPLVS